MILTPSLLIPHDLRLQADTGVSRCPQTSEPGLRMWGVLALQDTYTLRLTVQGAQWVGVRVRSRFTSSRTFGHSVLVSA